jgi:hypothetical protein
MLRFCNVSNCLITYKEVAVAHITPRMSSIVGLNLPDYSCVFSCAVCSAVGLLPLAIQYGFNKVNQ